MGLRGIPGKRRKRAVVLGLDGVPHWLIEELIKDGHLPFCGELCREGSLSKMEAAVPEVSSVSWTTFMTGANPGEHGIYGFMDFKPGTYDLFFPNSLDIKAPTLWRTLAEKGKRSVVINLPATYPAQPMEGVMISGFVAVDMKRAVYPPAFFPVLENMKYKVDLDLAKARHDPDYLFNELLHTLNARKKVVDILWKSEDWDFFMVVITGTDRLHHFQFESYFNQTDPFHDRFLEYYREIDSFIQWIYGKLEMDCDPESLFLMLSDHGFKRIKSEVYINRLLLENGYLKFSEENPRTIQEIGEGTTAFALDPSRVYINLEGKYPKGTVGEREYDSTVRDLTDMFYRLHHHGEPVVKKVLRKDQLYTGPFTPNAPDLVLLGNDGFDLKGMVNRKQVFGTSGLKGMHSQEDAFLYANRPRVQIDNIIQVKGLIDAVF